MLRTSRQRHPRTRIVASRRLQLIATLIAALVLAGAPAPVTGARILTVDRGDDPDPPAQACTSAANDCSLRGAILTANAEPGADTINLPARVYTLVNDGTDDNAQFGDLDITDDVAIVGASASTTIVDPAGIDRAFDIIDASVTMTRITIRRGLTTTNGGALYNRSGSTSTLTDIILDGNAAVSGGGIYNSGMLALSGSTIIRNLAGSGGALYNSGTLRVSASAVISNTADASRAPSAGVGGGIYNNGVLGSAAALAVVNSTISGNSATIDGGGLYTIQGDVQLSSVTIAGNTADSDKQNGGDGGGLIRIPDSGQPTKQVVLRNTLVADNIDTGGEAPDCATTKGPQSTSITSQGYNLVESITGCNISGNVGGNITGQPPKLGPLRNNGGPTPTHALLGGSPAIDAGNPAGCENDLGTLLTSDQRGFPRPQSDCDIGAYERFAGRPPPTIRKAFLPARIFIGGAATLVFTITNIATTTLSGLAFSDPMPTAIKVANPPNVSNSCGGSFSAPIGASAIGLAGGGLTAGATCTIRVSVTSATTGSHTNTASPASAAETGAGAPSNTATLIVEQPSYQISMPLIRK
jgi:hypothetical protein